jgi:RNA polymerase sigma-70 factor (ECF subfamily)
VPHTLDPFHHLLLAGGDPPGEGFPASPRPAARSRRDIPAPDATVHHGVDDAREADLVARARAGSAEAFSELVSLHQAAVRCYLSRHVRARAAIDDLAQEIFLAALRGLDGYRGEGSLRLWLFGIARRHAATHLRQEMRRRANEANDLELAVLRFSAEELERPEADEERELEALQRCLRKLPRESAQLVSAFYFRSESAADIARRLRRGEGAVRMTLLRIRQALRRCVEERLGTTRGRA